MLKNPGGRPTDYQPEFCERAIEILSQKDSVGLDEVAAELNICPKTLFNWRRQHPEFDQAVRTGLVKGKVHLLKEGRQSTQGSRDFNYNTPLFSRLLQTIYRDCDASTIEIEGWNDAKTIEEKFNLVSTALGNGDITPEQADKVCNVLTKHLQVTEVAALKARLDALESAK